MLRLSAWERAAQTSHFGIIIALMDSTEYSGLDDKDFERMMRVSELHLKQEELDLKAREFRRSNRTNPLIIGIFVAAIGLFGNVAVSYINASSQLRQEKRKDQAELILEAMKPPEITDRCINLVLLEGLGLADTSPRTNGLCTGVALYKSFA